MQFKAVSKIKMLLIHINLGLIFIYYLYINETH